MSYLVLRGRCSKCKEKISFFYPTVELITAILTFFVYKKIGLSLDFFNIIALFYLLIILSFIDFRYKAVPDYLLVSSLVISFFIIDFDFKAMFMFAGGFILLEIFVTFYIQNIK
jgi:leader peptidase (prepilin peptidase)/N-methyltransferase